MVGLPTLALAALLGGGIGGEAHARAGYYSNHPDVRWNTLETEHFYFHWPESKRDKDHPHYFTTEFTVRNLAEIAEVSYPKVCETIGYWLDEKTHVVLYDQDRGWEGNGFAIAEWDWTGFAARWGSTFRQRGRMEFLTDVFVHEFAHIVSLKAYLPWSEGTTGFQVGGLVEDEEWFRRWGFEPPVHTNVDLGVNVLFSAHTPFWWAEGGAEFWSDKAGYNVWGTSRDAFLRATVLEDRVLDHDEWTTRIDKSGFDGERGYNHGYSFGLYLNERFGDDPMTKMAHISADHWHWSWDQVVAEATGIESETLHAEWKASLEEQYGKQKAEIEARGVVQGRELRLTEPGWEKNDAEWQELSKKKQDEKMDGKTAYQELPSYSPDGRYIAWFERGLNVREVKPEEWGALGGTYLDEEVKADAKKLKQFGKRTWGSDIFEYYRVAWSPDGSRFVGTGPEDLHSEFLMNQGLTFNADGYDWWQLVIGTMDPSGKTLDVELEAIPNTLRATEAAWSPDGETIVFARYGDGTHELWSIKPDGSEAKQLTHFGDGTQVQGLSFTKGGTHVLVSLFTQFQQDLWLMEVETGALSRITDTVEDETDPMVGVDGRYYFTSDLGGVFNVYSIDPWTGQVEQHTEILDGAYGVNQAPGGHILYTAITGHGFRIRAIPADQLKHDVVDYPGMCGTHPEGCTDDAGYLAWEPPSRFTDVRGDSTKYNPFKASIPLSGWPVLRSTGRRVEAGAGFFLGDYSEAHYIEGEATFGKDNFFYLSYWLDQFWPSIMLGYMRYTYKGTYGYGVDYDGVVETTDDITVVDVKFEQASDDVWAYFTTMPSWALWGGVGVDGSRYSFRDAGDGTNFVGYTEHAGVSVFMEWTPSSLFWYSGDDWINPRGGRRLYVDFAHRWTSLVDPEVAGAVYDDGALLERYAYNQLYASYTEYIPLGLGIWKRGTLQLDLEGGFIDRNVMSWDEFIAGGRHPYHWGSGTIGNNVQFSGYEGWSLTGETMLIGNASYRFPLARKLHYKLGPTYTDSIYLQVFGTIGNLWSYRVDGDSHLEGYSIVADDESTIRREQPFQDYASKNSPVGQPNYWLSDVGVELRVRSFIWNDWDWDSFVRLAYGLQSTAGYGDVNADLISSSVARDSASELSDEVEPPTLRIYAGLGTGW